MSKKSRRAGQNPPEGGYLKASLQVLGLAGAAIAGAAVASYAVDRLGGTWSEGMQDAVIGGGGFILGSAIALLGTPGKVRSTIGKGLAVGTLTLGGVRYGSYKMGGPAVQAAVDAQRVARAAPAGFPVSQNAYMGLGAGEPVSSNAYMGYGAGVGAY